MLDALLAELRGIISQTEDDIRVYTLPVRIKVDRLGRQQLADGIMLIGDRPVDRAISALVGVATNSDFSGKKSEPVKKRFLSSSSDISYSVRMRLDSVKP